MSLSLLVRDNFTDTVSKQYNLARGTGQEER